MPYVLVSVEVRLSVGPVVVGDGDCDEVLMAKLGAKLTRSKGQNFDVWVIDDTPRAVLNHLERLGFTVVSSTGVGQSLIWTVHAPPDVYAAAIAP